ncbi:hypothetical protein BofuT4_uP105430.1 [Botrytis cinerea T4]|uniref:Uncharacterized protein n=1 Tax=Botryotinia fuckeliana (strain T4) TaxID=999810 RepID=G2Y9X8_BOTF4|nr:hypothetical protein BofuT4_uP105430.1 [Botrytis cinerea T4]
MSPSAPSDAKLQGRICCSRAQILLAGETFLALPGPTSAHHPGLHVRKAQATLVLFYSSIHSTVVLNNACQLSLDIPLNPFNFVFTSALAA